MGNNAISYKDSSGEIKIYYLFSDVGQVTLSGGMTLKSGQNHIDLYIQTETYSLSLGFDPDRNGTRNGPITYKNPSRNEFTKNSLRSPEQVSHDQEFQQRQMQLIYEDKSDPKCEAPRNKEFITAFQNEGFRIHQAMIPYRPNTTNGNASIYTTLTKIEQRLPEFKVQNPKYSAPGWGIDVHTYKFHNKIIYD